MLPNPPYASVDTNCISMCFQKTPHMPTVKQNVSEEMLTKHMYGPARTESPSHPVFTKTLPYQRGRKMYLHSCWPSPSIRTYNASQHFCPNPPPCRRHVTSIPSLDTKCNSTWVDKTQFKQPNTKNASQRVMTKPITCQQGHKIYFIMRWQSTDSSMDTKCINLCWPNPSYSKPPSAIKTTKCI